MPIVQPTGNSRRAFSLVELLVVIAILGVLLALLMPAVQRMRAEANKTECLNNLRNLGTAMAGFVAMHHVFPSNGGWDGKQTIPDVNGIQFTPETFDFTTSKAYQFGVGDPNLGPKDQTGSWGYSILPYIEQQTAYLDRDWTTPVALYICPSRRAAVARTVVSGDAYGTYKTGGWAWARTDYGCNLQAFESRPVVYGPSKFSDGLSNTILIGEKAYDRSVQAENWYYDESFFVGSSKGTSRGAPALTPDGPGLNGVWINYKDDWGSAHTGGVHFLFGDGAVRLLAFDVDMTLMTALLTPDGGETAAPP